MNRKHPGSRRCIRIDIVDRNGERSGHKVEEGFASRVVRLLRHRLFSFSLLLDDPLLVLLHGPTHKVWRL